MSRGELEFCPLPDPVPAGPWENTTSDTQCRKRVGSGRRQHRSSAALRATCDVERAPVLGFVHLEAVVLHASV